MDMSTLKEFITPENIEKGVNLITGAGVTKVLKSSKTFNNIWDITIGNRLDAWNQKSIFKNQQDVEKYKNECIDKISKIPEDKIQDPKLSIIGPALEASKFYIEEEDIRNMFTNLIASSMNSDYEDIPHSFVEIIKQLSPYDAKLFQSFDRESNALTELALQNSNGASVTYVEDIYVSPTFIDYEKNSISLTNLQKQGLIKIVYDTYLINESLYQHFEDLKKGLNEKFNNNFPPVEGLPSNLVMKKHIFKLTSLGKKFKNICCD